MCEGIEAELQGIALGDERLNKRSVQVLKTLASDPQASINAACEGWGDTLAAYRLFNNPSLSPEKVLAPHFEATRKRMESHPVVLIIQDTTELDFSNHPPRGGRCLDTVERIGFYDHTYLAVTPEGLALGVIGGEQFDRSPESLGKSRQRRSLPIAAKESFRWLTGYRYAAQLACELPAQRIISVADSEADIYDVYLEAQNQALTTHFIIRAKENRCTPQPHPEAGPLTNYKMLDLVNASPVRATRTLELKQTPKRAARQAPLEIRALRVTMQSPRDRRDSSLPPLTFNIVLAEEVQGPSDGTAVRWVLVTTLPIDTEEQILQALDYYAARWTIEVYYRVLKTGCRVEQIQLETLERVKNCLAFYKIIAWSVLYLTHLSRECSEIPCSAFFTDDEWQPTWRIVKKEPPPKKTPSLSQFMALVARLGGYNGRATEPPPGTQVIWTGLRRILDFSLAWAAFGKNNDELVYK
jgi:hypothetical protein